jgi:BON domain
MHGTSWLLSSVLAVILGVALAAAEQAQAATVAQQLGGGQGVCNLPQVVTSQDERAMQVADDALQERIEQALQDDPALQDSRIYVQSVHQGMVLLAGTAQTLSAHLRAVAVVASVPGVWWIASAIQSSDTLVEAEIWREPTPQQPRTAYGVEKAAWDMWITSATPRSPGSPTGEMDIAATATVQVTSQDPAYLIEHVFDHR